MLSVFFLFPEDDRKRENEQYFTCDMGSIKTVTFILCFIVHIGSFQPPCPSPCLCVRNAAYEIVSMKCDNADLLEIPQHLPSTLTSLTLRGNLIASIKQFSLNHLHNLKILDLSANRLTFLTDGCFNGLFSLDKLFVQHNSITVNNLTIPNGVFKDLKNLTVLNIQDNCDPYGLNTSYPDDSLSDLSSLEELHIDGLYNRQFGLGFQKLISLRILNLTGQDGRGRCGIENITETLFENFVQKLRYIDFSHCQINLIHPMAFSKMADLKTLDFTDNPHMGIEGVENVSYSLTFINLDTLILSYIYRTPDFHHFDLRVSSFKYFPNTSLTVLDLSNNKIEYIEPEVINYLPRTLTTFSLRDNSIHDARFLDNIFKLDKLITFDLSYQLRYNLFLEASVLKKHSAKITLPPHIENVFGSNMKIEYPVPPLTFTQNKLKVLDFSSNILKVWLGPWYGLHSLQLFNLSYNRLEFIAPTSFGDMHSLTTLLLAGNLIGHTINQDKQGLTFSNQTSLETLDLSANAIETLPQYIFVNLRKLRSLKLSNNSLVNVDFHVAEMKLLSVLDLSDNQLTHISPNFRNALQFISKRAHNISILLTGNEFSCSCDFLDFLKWMQANRNMIRDFDTLVCSHKSSLVSFEKLDEMLDEMKYECIRNTVVIVCAVGFVGILLFLSIPAIIYHKRWKLRYLYYTASRKTNPYRQIEEQPKESNAYISFPESLRAFVVNKLYPELTSRGLTLTCFEDITPGESQCTGITNCIQQSHKTVVLFADDYMNNFWNTFEFHMAIQEGICNRRETVIPVVMGTLYKCDAQPDIMAYLKSNKCIPYPGADHENTFWDYLEMRITK